MRVLLSLFLAILTNAPAWAAQPKRELDHASFAALMNEVAAGWTANDARRAADAFHPQAIYSEPPDKQLYRGRDALFRFFGRPQGRSSKMTMTWHHLSFNKKTQVGAGEFTFAWDGGQAHGMVSIRLRDELIANWREYFYESPLPWNAFQGANRF
jgi:hypothetical protein